ncbi:hypothetical protein, partial [Salmonella sp. s54925]|uniref:hypothetical protein n=1 Tax=Salmonella sp. s54925 TaxID=3159674 RepID=UPI003981147E
MLWENYLSTNHRLNKLDMKIPSEKSRERYNRVYVKKMSVFGGCGWFSACGEKEHMLKNKTTDRLFTSSLGTTSKP